MARTPAQALAWAASHRKGYSNYCLQYVREAYGIGSGFASAIAAWNGARKRHGSLSTAPDGAPVFMSHPKSKYGHVALLRRVGGVFHIETTNSAVGHPVLQRLDLWTGSYGYKVLGWTEDINGVDVCDPLPAAPKPAPTPAPSKPSSGSAILRRGSNGAEVGKLQSWLRNTFPGYKDDVKVRRGQLIGVDNDFGAQTEAWVVEFQERTGLSPDGVFGPATRAKAIAFGF